MSHKAQLSNRPGISRNERDSLQTSAWSIWYRPGSKDDEWVTLTLSWKDRRGRIGSRIVERNSVRFQRRELYNAAWVEELVKKEKAKINSIDASKSKWSHKVSSFADEVIKVATRMKPVVDIFVPSSPEYSVPYACLWVMFQAGVRHRVLWTGGDNRLTARSLLDAIPRLRTYGDMFPTDEMKDFLAQFYIHTVDLLWRLAKYYSLGFSQLTDAILPQTEYDFSIYLENIKKSSRQLKALCEIGHMAEQKDVKVHIESLHSEIRHLRQYIGTSRTAQAQQYASEVIDTWHDEIGDIEYEPQLWSSVQFLTDMRDH
ncbi:hypothetical protein PENSTE_c008G02833 [Penicillium steckii]|uniref:DUF7708 domain-containing protein n=1 Tax=Penicillium steckii TaxID=303698 RepID=A0A1V6TBY0_9EURO|nr:hypothetical protein PENSTE_c008G02833 [Penicillium steckii]